MVLLNTSMANEILRIEESKDLDNNFGYFVNSHDIRNALKSSHDSIIVFNRDGKVLLINEFAANIFFLPVEQVINTYLQTVIPLQKWANRRLFCRAIKYFNEAIKGIPQQFNWIEEQDKRPTKAFSVILNALVLDNEPVVVARIINITQAKTLEWVLMSLAEISNHGGINDVIDDITRLAGHVFKVDHASVDLIDGTEIAHTVSYYLHGVKAENIAHPLADTPYEQVKRQKLIFHYNGDVQQQFPKAQLLKDLNVYSFMGGPLINSEGCIVGLFVLLSEKAIDVNDHNKTLFRLFSERVSLEIERLLSHRKLQFLASIPQQDPNPVFRIQSGGGVLYTNSSGREILDYWFKQREDLPPRLIEACKQAKIERDVVRIELDVKLKSYLFIVVWVADFDQVNIYATDITELKLAQQKMRDLANYDTLTNVANRQFFDATLNQWIDEAKKSKTELALLLIDIDNFKTVNDTLGHHIGDKLLKNMAKRTSGCIRKEDFLARLGGDEFVVLLKLSDNTNIEKIAGKINHALSSPFEFGDYHLETACSIGISYYPNGGYTSSELLRNADTAMYSAKKNGKNQYAIYSNEGYDEVNSRLIMLKKDLKNALSKHEFYIDYQPQFDLYTKKIVGYEAYIRWRHPKKGLISPNEFIPIAEQTGYIYALGYWTIKKALQDYASTVIPISKGKISLNIAVSQLNDQHFIDNLCNSLIQTNIPHDSVILDIAEQISTVQYRHLDANLDIIRGEGISLSLDNFGKDHSNLARLLEIPFNYVKIDHSLLHLIDEFPRQGAFISGIIDLASKLDLLVIQKGVESEKQNDTLKKLGCHFAQGFYYCRPLAIDDLEQFINTYYR